jgi:hypothetical protein
LLERWVELQRVTYTCLAWTQLQQKIMVSAEWLDEVRVDGNNMAG